MKEAKYQKIISVHEMMFLNPRFLSDVLAKLIYHMFDVNETNKENSWRFQFDTVPVEGLGYIGIRLRWGRIDKDLTNDQSLPSP